MKLVNLNNLKALHNLSTKEIEQAIEREEDLCAICVEEGDKYYSPGEETRASGLKCISSVRWGAMSNWYVKNTEDIPTGWRIIQLAQSPFERAISGFQKEETYELSFGYLPEDIKSNLVGDGFHYTYKGDAISIYIKEGQDEEIWDAIIHEKAIHKNSLNLRQFRLVKPWIRKIRSTESCSGHSLGWHDSLYGHLG